MNNVSLKVDMAYRYLEHLASDLSPESNAEYWLVMQAKVNYHCGAMAVGVEPKLEVSNDRQGAGVSGDAAGTG
jgi:hypothetical protein